MGLIAPKTEQFSIRWSVGSSSEIGAMPAEQNIVGPQVRQLRYQQDLTQAMLSARCEVLGWNLSRGTLSKIEARLRCVTDEELLILAKALNVPVQNLYP